VISCKSFPEGEIVDVFFSRMLICNATSDLIKIEAIQDWYSIHMIHDRK
jgi:hypothetical protein